MAEPIYNWERREKLLEIARRLDELAALSAARVQQAERAAAARRAAHAAFLAEAEERIRSFDLLSTRPDPCSLEALHELALRERMAERPGTASDASWDWPSLGDYWHFLIHPSEMDADLQTAQKLALGTSAAALGGAAALTVAGLGAVTAGAAGAAAAPVVLTELADTAVEEGVSQLAGVPIILPFGVVDVVQDAAKLGVKKLAQEGLEEVAESVASKGGRSGDAAGAASRNAGRTFTDKLADITKKPSDWVPQSIHAEPATSMRARGGVSEQIIYRNPQTGESIVRHRVTDAGGRILDDHFRPTYKPRIGEVD